MILLEKITNPSILSEQEISSLDFDNIASYIEQEKIDKAVELINQALSKGCFDIRLMVYYLYAYFLEQGIKGFGYIFEAISIVHNKYFEHIQPKEKKIKQIETSINWFFSQIVEKLKYYEKLYQTGRMHPVWEKSVLQLSQAEINEIIAQTNHFIPFLQTNWPNSNCMESILYLIKWMKEITPLIDKSSQQLLGAVDEIQSISESVDEAENEVKEKTQQIAQVALSPRKFESKDWKELLSQSKNMDFFCKKLQVFELLVKRKDFKKASLVASDITKIIDNFDPSFYFPKLISTYFSLLASNINELKKYWENSDNVQRQILEKLYHTDLDSFVNWEQ